ncbi:EamA family transporter [Flagellimonas halotolerans]|uniref:EamA family transporter n=1 Tax=Flagellimonas halotolerans TaxID=3112164 RepID=A0ABU6ISM2_9FLAO|nr:MULTISPECIES: EamA family transporter [unclassified Allomuricauda]MEC3966192.1 EamA family transporter [Muricauda sp. SYSU M86414]MEC4266122.1 EamA family transporter [Muricauda sp. SYSU M84420]
MKSKLWLVFAIVTTVFWGIWGAFTGLPTENGFPETLIYCVWAVTMVPPAIIALKLVDWKLHRDKKSIFYGCLIGLLGAGGQMVLFHAVTQGPSYLIFPIISLSPMVTIILSYTFLKERTGILGTIGIILALLALPLFDYSDGSETTDYGYLWFILAVIVLLAWGLQAYFMKFANESMNAESIFFYMAVTGLAIIPIALLMTDFSEDINYGVDGPVLAAAIQILNSIGALCLVYAFRYGKAMVVSPMTNAGAPLITSVISMIVLGFVPGTFKVIGIILAVLAAFFLAFDPGDSEIQKKKAAK